MAWFRRPKSPKAQVSNKQLKIPEGLWIKCNSCKEIVYRHELEKNDTVCPKCNYHFRISAEQRLQLLFNDGQYKELDKNLSPNDPLKFKDSQKYRDRIKSSQERTGLNDAIISAQGKIGSHELIVCAFEFGFMGGSMASVVGEKIAHGMELAAASKLPFMSISASGGARMQEGLISLMQMAKTSAATVKLAQNGLPFISLLTDPTMGGVSASFAMLGDVILAEPNALIGFAGPRVIEQTIREPLPQGFQRTEFLLDHGMIDIIVNRYDIKPTLINLLDFFNPNNS